MFTSDAHQYTAPQRIVGLLPVPSTKVMTDVDMSDVFGRVHVYKDSKVWKPLF